MSRSASNGTAGAEYRFACVILEGHREPICEIALEPLDPGATSMRRLRLRRGRSSFFALRFHFSRAVAGEAHAVGSAAQARRRVEQAQELMAIALGIVAHGTARELARQCKASAATRGGLA